MKTAPSPVPIVANNGNNNGHYGCRIFTGNLELPFGNKNECSTRSGELIGCKK